MNGVTADASSAAPHANRTSAIQTTRTNAGRTANKIKRICSVCGTSETVQWRRGPHDLQGRATACNPCGLRWQKQKNKTQQLQTQTALNALNPELGPPEQAQPNNDLPSSLQYPQKFSLVRRQSQHLSQQFLPVLIGQKDLVERPQQDNKQLPQPTLRIAVPAASKDQSEQLVDEKLTLAYILNK